MNTLLIIKAKRFYEQNYADESKIVPLTCVMNGFEGNKTSKPKWTTDFKDDQISKAVNGPSWTEEGYAGWDINVTISSKDSGDKVMNY